MRLINATKYKNEFITREEGKNDRTKSCIKGSAVLVSMVNTFTHLVVNPINKTQIIVNLLELCGWWENGVILAFPQ